MARSLLEQIPFEEFRDLPEEEQPRQAYIRIYKTNLAEVYAGLNMSVDSLKAFADALDEGPSGRSSRSP